MNMEHKYKGKDEYKDNDEDKDAERITESLSIPSMMVDTSHWSS